MMHKQQRRQKQQQQQQQQQHLLDAVRGCTQNVVLVRQRRDIDDFTVRSSISSSISSSTSRSSRRISMKTGISTVKQSLLGMVEGLGAELSMISKDSDDNDLALLETKRMHGLIHDMIQEEQEKCNHDVAEFRKLRHDLAQVGCVTSMSVHQMLHHQARISVQEEQRKREKCARSA